MDPMQKGLFKPTIYRGWKAPGAYVWSPFVTKLEFRLRVSGIPYSTEAGSPSSGPKGKIPYINLKGIQSTDGPPQASDEFLGDSTLIIKNLVERNAIRDLNAQLDASSKAYDLSVRALLEDKLSFYHMRERWCDNYYTMREHILSSLPYPLRVAIGLIIYRNTCKTLYGNGVGRFNNDEIRLFRREIWENLNALLVSARQAAGESKEPFWVLGNDQPTEADGSVFGFIVSVLICSAAPESREVVKSFPVLIDYAERIHERFFPDYRRLDEY